MAKVMLTGATGFIGSHIVREFCAKGIEVGCLVRESSSLDNLEGLEVEVKRGDITSLEQLTEAFAGCEVVIHNAAKVGDWGKYSDFYESNVTGTLNVLKGCVASGIKYVILTGSVSAYGEDNCLEIKDETSPHNSHYPYLADRIFPSGMNFYRDTKALAKEAAVEFASENNLNLTILEPVWVYGEREFNTGFFEYLKSASSGLPFLPGSNKNKFHVIYAGDLARAYFLAYSKRLPGINAILVGNEKAENMNRIYSLFCASAGFRKPHNFPRVIIYPFALVLELLYTLLGCANPPLLTRGRVNMFYDNIEFSVQKAETLLGFKAVVSLEDGISRTVAWYKDNGLI